MSTDTFIPVSSDLLGEPALACPVCGDQYVHPVGLECRSPGRRNGHVVIDSNGIGIDPTQPPVGRGTLIVLKFQGECGHAFHYALHFNKGNTFVMRRVDRQVDRDRCPETIWRD